MRKHGDIAVCERKQETLSLRLAKGVQIGAIKHLHLDWYLWAIRLEEFILQIAGLRRPVIRCGLVDP